MHNPRQSEPDLHSESNAMPAHIQIALSDLMTDLALENMNYKEYMAHAKTVISNPVDFEKWEKEIIANYNTLRSDEDSVVGSYLGDFGEDIEDLDLY